MKKKVIDNSAVNYLLVDGSGSMQGRTVATREGLASFVEKLKMDVPDSRLVIVFFGATYEQKYAGLARDCPTLEYSAYLGTTHLWGAYLKALGSLAEETARFKSLTLISDGQDMGNGHWCADASKERVIEAVKKARKDGINIGLLFTEMNGYALAATLGMDEQLVQEYKAEGKGVTRAADVYASSVVRSSKGKRAGLTMLERAAIDESPEELAAKNGEELVTLNKAAKLLQKMYEGDVNQFFAVTFKKRTPPYLLRTYQKARFHVVSKMKGANGAGAAYNFLEKKLVPVWVMDTYTDAAEAKKNSAKVGDEQGFRSIPLDGIIAIRAGGKAYRVQTGG